MRNEFTLDLDLKLPRVLGVVVGGISGVFIEYLALTGNMPLHRGQPASSLDMLVGAAFGLPFLLIGALALFGNTATTFYKDDMTWMRWWSFMGRKTGTPLSMAGLQSVCIKKTRRGGQYMRTIYVTQLGEAGPEVDWGDSKAESLRRATQLASFLGVELIDRSDGKPSSGTEQGSDDSRTAVGKPEPDQVRMPPEARVLKNAATAAWVLMIGIYIAIVYFKAHPNDSVPATDTAGSSVSTEIKLPAETRQLSQADLTFGERQVDAMIEDRPQLKDFVTKGDVVYNWTARRFGGLACGERISWDPGDLTIGFGKKKPASYTSDNQYPHDGKKGFIRMRALDQYGKPHTGQKLWACAVYELYNIGSGRKFHAVAKDFGASDWQMPKEVYIDRMTRIEFENSKKLHRFYHDVWVPFLNKKGLVPDPHGWWAAPMPTFEEWKATWKKDGYPYDFWGVFWDLKHSELDKRSL